MDHRDYTHYPAGIVQDHERMVIVVDVDYIPLEGEEFEVPSGEFPAKYDVCPNCDGKGKYVNPSIDSNGLSSEDFAEDPDFREDYFSGRYDIQCRSCNGRNVILVPATKEGQKVVDAILEEEWGYRAEVAAERRACGYY